MEKAEGDLWGAEGCSEPALAADSFWPDWFSVSPRNCPAGVVNGRFGPDFPGTHFLGDLLQLSFASSQRDLFEDGWLEFVVRVYWLKARFLALQVGSVVGCLASTCWHPAEGGERAACVCVHVWHLLGTGLRVRKWDVVGSF